MEDGWKWYDFLGGEKPNRYHLVVLLTKEGKERFTECFCYEAERKMDEDTSLKAFLILEQNSKGCEMVQSSEDYVSTTLWEILDYRRRIYTHGNLDKQEGTVGEWLKSVGISKVGVLKKGLRDYEKKDIPKEIANTKFVDFDWKFRDGAGDFS